MSKIAELNDRFRRNPHNGLGRLVITRGVCNEGVDFVAKCVQAVIAFDAFNKNNDPHSEHDFFAFKVDDVELYWKCDYYDLSMKYGSPNPADPSVTVRIGTIMLVQDY